MAIASANHPMIYNMLRNICLLLACTGAAIAAPAGDLVKTMPGFDGASWPFDFYSGVLPGAS